MTKTNRTVEYKRRIKTLNSLCDKLKDTDNSIFEMYLSGDDKFVIATGYERNGDIANAVKWFNLANERGHVEAKERITGLTA